MNDLTSSNAIRLDAVARPLRLAAGAADLFAVRALGDGTYSRRFHVSRLQPGAQIRRFTAHSEYIFLLVLTPGASLEPADDTAAPWVETLLQHITRRSVASETVMHPGTQAVREGEVCVPDGRLLWLHNPHSALFSLHHPMAVVETSQEWIPVSADSTLVAGQEAECSAYTASEVLQYLSEDRLIALAECLCLQLVEHSERRILSDDTRTMRAAKQRRLDAVSVALRSFASILQDEDIAPVSQATYLGDRLLAAVALVSSSAGIAIKIPSAKNVSLRSILDTANIRYREVRLEGKWWKQDMAPAVAFDDQGAAVAILPYKGGYRAVNPKTSISVVIDDQNGNIYAGAAVELYRSFPEGVIGFKQIAAFAFEKVRSDAHIVVLAGIASGLLGILAPYASGVIFDVVIPEVSRSQLVVITFAIVAGALFSGLFDFVRNMAMLRIQLKSNVDLEAALWDRLLRLPVRFFRRYTVGELATRANGFNAINQLISGATVNTIVTSVFAAVQFVLMYTYSAKLATWAAAITAAVFAAYVSVAAVRVKKVRTVQSVYQQISGTVLQFLSSIAKIRVSGSEAFAFSQWATLFRRQRDVDYKARTLQNITTVMGAVVPVLGTVVIYKIFLDLPEDAQLTTGDFVSFSSSFSTVLSGAIALATAMETVLMCVPLYEYAKPILQEQPETDQDKPEAAPIKGHIELRNIVFRYSPELLPALNNISMEVQPGEFVAVVGPSGSGKSTLLRLLLGFDSPEQGSVLYDGADIRDMEIRSLRRQIGAVLQSGKVMSGNILKNILGASSNLTERDAWEAAEMAGFDNDIREMPMGMQTIVAEGGGTLSGGQRQRLLIARALVRKPRIILFDEATSALDNRTQEIVSRSLEAMQATRIVVAHRLSTVKNADKIYVMVQGVIVEQGTFHELLAKNGVFTRLASRQMA